VEQAEQYAAEWWFRRRGLPAVVRGRPTHVLVRVVPAVVFLAVFDLVVNALFLIDGTSDADFERLMRNKVYAVSYNALLIALVVLPALGAWLAVRWERGHTIGGPTARRGAVVGAVAVLVYVLVWPLLEFLLNTVDGIVVDLAINAGLVVGALGIVYVGGGAVFGWAVRAAIRQIRGLGQLTSRALPLLLLFAMFGFFTAEIWQANTALTRSQMWQVVAFFVVMSLVFLAAVLSDELRELIGSRPADVAKLHDTPFAGHPAFDGEHLPLRRAERVNMVLVLLLSQALQALVFGVLVFVFFATFGLLAVRPEVMKAWATRDPSGGALFGVQVPVPNELLQVSMFLAAFSVLYFVGSTVTDARYRQSFYDPLIDHMAVSLCARHVYLTRLG
jgi:hypothetical protein